MNRFLYYFIPWPESQKLMDIEPDKEHWSFTDPDFASGCFVEKEWFDSIRTEHGL